jgi:hypothetical protein
MNIAIVVYRLHDVFHCCVNSHRHGVPRKHNLSAAVCGPLPSNGRLLWPHSFCLQRMWDIASSPKLLVPCSLQAYRHSVFTRAALVKSVIGFQVPRLSRWLLSNCSRCSLLKASTPEWFPDKVWATIISVVAFRWILHTTSFIRVFTSYAPSHKDCSLGDRTTILRPHGSPQSWPGGRTEFSSRHWLASGVGDHNCGCRTDGPLSLALVPSRGISQTAGRSQVGWL